MPPSCSEICLWGGAPGAAAVVGYRPDVVAHWTCTDAMSGLASARWSVGTEPGLDDAMPWRDEFVANPLIEETDVRASFAYLQTCAFD